MIPASFSVHDGDLRVRWADRDVTFGGTQLRMSCRCAHCRYRRLNNAPASDIAAVITAVTPMGYGLQLHFSDGHTRGIFPWQYLYHGAQSPHGFSTSKPT